MVPFTPPDKIDIPVLEKGENERETHLDATGAEDIGDYCGRFHPDHVLPALIREISYRMKAVHSLDVDDIDFENVQGEIDTAGSGNLPEESISRRDWTQCRDDESTSRLHRVPGIGATDVRAADRSSVQSTIGFTSTTGQAALSGYNAA